MRLTEEMQAPIRPAADLPAPTTLSAAEADTLAAETSGLKGAEALLDAAALSQLLQREVTITHVRSKPGHSLVAAHTDSEGAAAWTMLTRDSVKFHNALERATAYHAPLQVHRAEEPYLFSGSVWTDPQLAKELAEARAALGQHVDWRVLRYNPRRRVVAAVRSDSTDKVVRVMAQGADHLLRTARLWRRQGLPVTDMLPLGGRRSATIAALWGVGDLSRLPHPPAAEAAGAAVAKLHALPAGALRRSAAPDPRAAAKGLGEVAPWTGRRASRIAEELEVRLAALRPGRAAQIHGDLSPDQVVVAAHRSHKIRLIDFDRTGSGPPMRDLGSWTAACRRDQQPEMIDAFLTGYAAHAPLRFRDASAWEAYAHLAAAPDFFRRREPEWPARTVTALDLAEEALTR